mgnify:CR=1 FL=1
MSEPLDGLGNRLAKVCAREGLNQSEFALRIGVSPGFVSDILRGNKRPGCEFLASLRQSLGVSIDWLLTGKGSPVSIDSSTALLPSTTTPSTGTFSPGRTLNRSPT